MCEGGHAGAGGYVRPDGAEEDIVVGVVSPDEVGRRVVAQVHLAAAHPARPMRARARVVGAALGARAGAVHAGLAMRHAALDYL